MSHELFVRGSIAASAWKQIGPHRVPFGANRSTRANAIWENSVGRGGHQTQMLRRTKLFLASRGPSSAGGARLADPASVITEQVCSRQIFARRAVGHNLDTLATKKLAAEPQPTSVQERSAGPPQPASPTTQTAPYARTRRAMEPSIRLAARMTGTSSPDA